MINEEEPARLGNLTISIFLILVIILASLSLLLADNYLKNSNGNLTRSEETTTSTTTQTTIGGVALRGNQCSVVTSCSAENSLGLELVLTLNGTSFKASDAIFMNITEINTRWTINNVTSVSSWPNRNLFSPMCGLPIQAFGIGLFKGFYALDNFSNAEPLDVWPPNCPIHYVFQSIGFVGYEFTNVPISLNILNSYSFLPESDRGNYSVSRYSICVGGIICSNSTLFTLQMSMNQALDLYITNSTAAGISKPLTPGIYTLAAADEWDAIVLLVFSIVP